MPIGRGLGVGLTLADGRVLVAGGYTVEGSTNSVFYDPTENAWTLGPPMPQQFGLTSALFELPDGRVLATEQSGAEVLRLLRAPVAVEPDQTVGGASGFVSAVTLDGSASSDPDSDALARYVWSEGATVLADGTSPTAPVGLAVGTHHLTLTVTDDTGMSGSTNFTVVVQDLVAAGQEALAACTSTLTSTQAALMACTTTLTPTQAALTAANGTIASLQAQITLVQQDLRTALGDPSFTIPGATPVEQMQSLTTAISSLSSGPKKALYEALGGTKKKK
jgi:hypothetical protein